MKIVKEYNLLARQVESMLDYLRNMRLVSNERIEIEESLSKVTKSLQKLIDDYNKSVNAKCEAENRLSSLKYNYSIKEAFYQDNIGKISDLNNLIVQAEKERNAWKRLVVAYREKHLKLSRTIDDDTINKLVLSQDFDRMMDNPEKLMLDDELRQVIVRGLNDIPKREADVLRMYFSIGMDEEYSIEDIAHCLDITYERTRQLFAQGIRRLRHPSRRVSRYINKK